MNRLRYAIATVVLAACGGSSGSNDVEPPASVAEDSAAVERQPAGQEQTAPPETSEDPAPAGGAARDFQSVEKVLVVNEPGQYVALEEVLVPGAVTVVDFYADWCGACKVMEEKLLDATADEPRIVVRKIDIEDTDTDVAQKYDIGSLPHLRIYGPDGELAHVLVGNEALQAADLSRDLL